MRDVAPYKLRIEGIQCVIPSSGTAQSGVVHSAAGVIGTAAGGAAGLVLGGVVTVGSAGTLTAPGVAVGAFVFVEIEVLTQAAAAGGRELSKKIGASLPDQVYVHLDGEKIFPNGSSSKNMWAGDFEEIGVEISRSSSNHRISIYEKDVILDDDLLYSVEIPPAYEGVRVAVALDPESPSAKNPEGSIYLLWLTATRDRNSREIENEKHKEMLKDGENSTAEVRPGLGFWTVAKPQNLDTPDGEKELIDPPLYTDFIGRFGEKSFDGWAHRTIQVEAVNDHVFCLGRSDDGMEIYEVMGGDWELRGACQRFKDAGWGKGKHYKTIQTTTIDDKLYLLGRGGDGVEIYLWNIEDNNWSQSLATCDRFRSTGWDPAHHHETIQTVVFNNNLYLVGRGAGGMDFYLWTGRTWQLELDTAGRFVDAGWSDHESYWRTIQTVVTQKGLHLVGRGSHGVEIHTWENGTWHEAPIKCDRFIDPHWRKACYSDTIRALALGNRIVVIGRGVNGVDAYVWNGSTWSDKIESAAFSDSDGGGSEHVWASISATVYDDHIWMVGQAATGAKIYKLDVDQQSWTEVGTIEVFSNGNAGMKSGVARTLGFLEVGGKLLVHGRVPEGL